MTQTTRQGRAGRAREALKNFGVYNVAGKLHCVVQAATKEIAESRLDIVARCVEVPTDPVVLEYPRRKSVRTTWFGDQYFRSVIVEEY